MNKFLLQGKIVEEIWPHLEESWLKTLIQKYGIENITIQHDCIMVNEKEESK